MKKQYIVTLFSFFILFFQSCQLPESCSEGGSFCSLRNAALDLIVKRNLGLPQIPGEVKTIPSDSKNTVTWNAVVDATYYKVYKGTTADITTWNDFVVVSKTEFIHAGIINGTSYYYRISAVNDKGESGLSLITMGVPIASATPTPPASPVITAVGGNSFITIAWPTVSGALSYNVYYDTTPGISLSSPFVNTALTTYNHTLLPDNTLYYYRVTALNGNGESLLSNEVSASTWFAVEFTSEGWNCLSISDCTDYYEIDMANVNDNLLLEIVNVSGSSVVRWSLHDPSTAWGGNDFFSASLMDNICSAMDGDMIIPVTVNAAGVWKLAVGRDTSASGGNSGNYTLRIKAPSSSSITSNTKISNDAASDHSITTNSCPF